MESDLPLMELAEEDDSLLQHFPDPIQTPSKSSLNYFNCSPFALPPSHTKSLKDGVHMEKPSSSSSEASNNKENIKLNNVEVPKLGMGPMQMKRRKKGGGYNLRKSLAWDRAFFTDEGILDPRELTLITGINAGTCGGGLHTISEEGNSSFSSDTNCTKEPNDKEASEEDLLKELHDKSRTSKGNGEKTCCSVGNHDSLSHRRVTHKILSIDRTNRFGSKVGGCSEPLAASSLKRPGNSNTLKTAKKESKLPKLPTSKPGSCFSGSTKGSTTASQLRPNLIPKPTINVQKNVALKSSVKNVHGSQSKAKTGLGSLHLPIRELSKKTVRNLKNSSSKATSSTKSQLVQADGANSGSEVVPDRFKLCEIQEGSAPLSAEKQAQHTATKLDNSLPKAARLTGSGPCHIERASNRLMISDRLHPCESQEGPATLAVSHHMNLHNSGVYPPNIQPARPSGLRLPSPSLRFFDQRTALEPGSLQQEKNQQSKADMVSNRNIGEPRPPAAPTRPPMKSNDITENVCSVVLTSGGRCSAPSTLSTHCGSTQLIPSPNHLGSTSNGVPDSDIYSNLEREIVQRVDIKVPYECRASELEVHKVIELEKRILGHEGNMNMEKIAWKSHEEITVTHPTEQLGEGIGAKVHLAGNVVYNKVGVGTRQVMSQGNDEKIPLVPETRGRFVLKNEEDRLQNYTAISMSTSGQSIQLQEQNISIAVDGSMNFMQDLAQTSREQADTEKSDASKVNPESHLDAGSLKAENQESQKDVIGKREDDLVATQWVSPGLENDSVVLQHNKTGQENDVAKVVDELYKSLHMEDDAGCSADSPCNETKGRISLTSGESLKDEAGNRGNTDARELKGSVTMLDASSIPFQNMDTEQGNDDADSVAVFPTRLSVRDAGTLVLHDNPSAEGFYINPSTSIKNKAQLQDSPVRDAVTLVLRDNPSSEGFHINTSTSIRTKAQLQDSPVRDVVTLVLRDNPSSEGFHINTSTSIKNKAQLQDTPVRDAVTLVLRDNPFSEGFHINTSTSIKNKAQLQDTAVRDVVTLVLRDNSSSEGFHINASTSVKNKAQLQDSPVRDAVTMVLHDNQSSKGLHINPSTLIKNKVLLQDSGTANQSAKATTPCVSALPNSQFRPEGWAVTCIMSAESSSLEEGPCDNVTELNDYLFQEKGGSNYSKAILMEEQGQKQDGVDVALVPGQPFAEARMEFREVAPLIDGHNHSSLTRLRPEVNLISGIASVDDNSFFKTESVLRVAQCASTYPHSLTKEGLDIAAATIESDFKIHEENQKSQEMGIIIGSLSEKSIVDEESHHSCRNILEANPTIQRCTGELETYNQFQNENQTLEGSETINNVSKIHLEDAHVQLLDGDILAHSCSSLTSAIHNHSIRNVDHSDIFADQPEFSDTGIKREHDSISNRQLLTNTDSVWQESVSKGVTNVVDHSDVYECDRKPSNTIVHSPPVAQVVGLQRNNDGQLCVEYGTSGSTVVDSIAEHSENYSDRQFTYNTECSNLSLLSKLEPSGKDEMIGDACMEYCSAGEESCSFLSKVADSMLEEKATLFGDFVDIGQVLADNKRVCMKDSLSTEKNATLDKPNNALDSVIVVPEQSISLVCDCDIQNSNGSSQICPIVGGNVSDLNRDDQANKPQGFDGIMSLLEAYDHATNGQSGYGLESNGQEPSESYSNFPVSQHPSTGGNSTSTTCCSVAAESCLVAGEEKSLGTSTFRIGTEGSKISFGEEVETEALQEGKCPMVDEFHHELDGGSDLKKNKDATVLIKRSNNIKKQDNSLVIHPPNAVPFSDEWLAAIEAAGEEILTMKCGAVQHSPPDKSFPEPGPWSPVKKKANQIGPYDCTKYTNAMPSNPH